MIRDSVDADTAPLQAIYAQEVLCGTASFEWAPPDIEEMHARRRNLLAAGYPHIVAEIGSQVAGYAYAGPYRSRAGYRYTVESSVYVAEWARERGVGTGLLERLIELCEGAGFRQMIAVIGDSAHTASISLHRRAGFHCIGTLDNVGFKFGRWLDSVLMQRQLGPGASEPPQVS